MTGKEIGRVSENINPNIPLQKSGNSHLIGSAKLKKSAPKDPIRISSFQSSIQERRFGVAKKNLKWAAPASVTCNCKEKPTNSKKCPCIAYENLHASQEFFRARVDDARADSNVLEEDGKYRNREAEKNQDIKTTEEAFGFLPNESKSLELDEIGFMEEAGSSNMKRMRNRLLEEESGRVMHFLFSSESFGRAGGKKWEKQLKVTSLHPFNLKN